MNRAHFFKSLVAGWCGLALFAAPLARAQAPEPPDPTTERVNEAMKRAAKFFLEKQNKDDGGIYEVEVKNYTAMTALAVLALAAMGHQPGDPTPEGTAMKKALDYVLRPENQEPNGYFGKRDGSRMYGHGIITLMLSEMLGMGADEKQDTIIRERCRKAIKLILDAQAMPKNDANRGGWRYLPQAADSDMSVTCWQTMALRSAKNAGLDVPKEAIDLAVRYIKGLYSKGSGRRGADSGFGYASPGQELSTTAEGLLALQICGDYESEETKGASERLFRSGIKSSERWFYYTAYYYAQGMHQRGDKFAPEGRKVVASVLLPLQSQQGWWDGIGGEERQGGKIYATALAVLALSVKNHYLPIYQR